MPEPRYAVGVDIGGTHVSSAIVDITSGKLLSEGLIHNPVNSGASAIEIMDAWAAAIKKCIGRLPQIRIEGVGIAMPGPCDYERGICAITGLGKFGSLFGVNMRQYLSTELGISASLVRFLNDASCFVLGEQAAGAARNADKVIGITLGTGFGSTFLQDGKVVTSGPGVPEGGMFWNVPYRASIADDYFSSRWFIGRYKELTGENVDGVAALVQTITHDPGNAALQVMKEFADALTRFIEPYVMQFRPGCLIIGGSISLASQYFVPQISESLSKLNCEVRISALFDKAAMTGAAFLLNQPVPSEFRKQTSERVDFPILKSSAPENAYDIFPAFHCDNGLINTGFEALVAWMANHNAVVIDGYVGVFFNDICQKIDFFLKQKGITAVWMDISAAMKDEKEINALMAPFLGGDDPLFGTRTTLELKNLFDEEKLSQLRPVEAGKISVITGCGAALAGWDAPIIYIDLPKNELQYRMREKSISNLGCSKPGDNKQMYKRFYFADWPILNRHKQKLLPSLAVIADGQRQHEITWMEGANFREMLGRMSRAAFRVRPWFEPGSWGGNWMKNNIPGLPQDVPNYAWSFELIVPENGIVFDSDNRLLETSFDFLMYHNAGAVLGDAEKRFGTEFPIRFDYLDTFDGGNLSVQCHPREEYIRNEFGENFTQDESYYILETKNEAKVYLGFAENIDPAEFRSELDRSQKTGSSVDIDRFVMSHPAAKHDLFLIPCGTVHGSGKNNVVLEISSTPYIFTFKMYDWLRNDLDGKPRTLNIDRAFKNLEFSRKGQKVMDEHIARPRLISHGADWKLYRLATHPLMFYDVHRFEFMSEVEVFTENQCHVMMLVEGTSIEVITADSTRQVFHYAETFVIPAAAVSYRLINLNSKVAKVVKAFVKPDQRVIQ